MHNGEVVEFDKPENLCTELGSYLSEIDRVTDGVKPIHSKEMSNTAIERTETDDDQHPVISDENVPLLRHNT